MRKNIPLFYLHEAFLMLTLALQALSVPYLFFSLSGGLRAYFAWALCNFFIVLILVVPLFDLAMRIRQPRLMMLLWLAGEPLAAYFFSRTEHPNALLNLIPASICFALFCAGYWPIRHWWFSISGTEGTVGRQVSTLLIARVATGAVGALATGYLGDRFGLGVVFQLSLVTACLSLLPLALLELPKQGELPGRQSLAGIVRFNLARKIKPSYFCEGVAEIGLSSMWGGLLLVLLPGIKLVGAVVALGALGSALLGRGLGVAFDNNNRSRPLGLAVWLRVFSSGLAVLAAYNPLAWLLVAADTATRLTTNILYASLDSYLYAFSRAADPVRFILCREVFLNFGRCVTCALVLLVLDSSSVATICAVMLIGGLANLGWLRLPQASVAQARTAR
ncbi:MAG: hypothetical protein K1X79_11025 [Oligoflexia bacterium]|nr:hypothetical protein [Oligoflexia bacterium]